jgi:ubiquinone/menaquinone biosynthesis C-methylase UbiE
MNKTNRHIATEQRSFIEILEEFDNNKHWAKTFFSRLKRVSPIPDHARILDIGAGAGEFIAACYQLGYHCDGIEPCEEARLNAGKLAAHLGIPIHIVEGRGESIPYDGGTFDVVYARSVIEHVADAEKVFAEVSRVVKPGGVFWFQTASSICPRQSEIEMFPFFGWYPDSLKVKIMNWARDAKPKLIGHTKTPAIHWFTPSKANRILRTHGFDQIHDRWDLRGLDEGGSLYKLALTGIRSTRFSKTIADILVPDCAYAAIKQ